MAQLLSMCVILCCMLFIKGKEMSTSMVDKLPVHVVLTMQFPYSLVVIPTTLLFTGKYIFVLWSVWYLQMEQFAMESRMHNQNNDVI